MRQKISPPSPPSTATDVSNRDSPADAELILGRYTEYLQERGYGEIAIRRNRRFVLRAAEHLASRGEDLTALTRDKVPWMLRQLLGARPSVTYMHSVRAALRSWLKFKGTFQPPPPPCAKWIPVLDEYERFLIDHRGAAPATCALGRFFLYDYFHWQFAKRDLDWSAIAPHDLWRYATDLARRYKRTTVKRALCALRSFFQFLHLRGYCARSLTPAIPAISVRGRTFHPGVLSPSQRKALLSACRKQRLIGRRNYAIALCMIDLGLRRCEVAQLKLADFDQSHGILTVPPAKAEDPRQLPLPPHVASALKDYLQHERPTSNSDVFFLRHRHRCGQPISAFVVSYLVKHTYRRCGFPTAWTGPHRLRHTFATRLFQRGATLKQLADVLGHRRLQTSRGYTHLDIDGLRQLARPWPL